MPTPPTTDVIGYKVLKRLMRWKGGKFEFTRWIRIYLNPCSATDVNDGQVWMCCNGGKLELCVSHNSKFEHSTVYVYTTYGRACMRHAGARPSFLGRVLTVTETDVSVLRPHLNGAWVTPTPGTSHHSRHWQHSLISEKGVQERSILNLAVNSNLCTPHHWRVWR